MDSVEARVGAIEGTMVSMDGKLDAIVTTLATHTAGRAVWRWIVNTGVAASGWAAMGLTWWRHP